MANFAKRLTESSGFQHFIVALILSAGVISGVETYMDVDSSSTLGHALLVIQDIILWIFVAEIVLKIVACGARPWTYFQAGWNLFDFLIVVICMLPVNAQFTTVFRMARLVRTLRLITILPKLQLLVGALLRAIPALGYIGILLGLHFYMYAVTGTFLFRQNDPIRFGSLHESFLTLFQVLTLEGWNDVLATQYLGSDAAYDDAWKAQTEGIRVSTARPMIAAAYFVSFIMLGTMIMLNLFTGVIITSMEEAAQEAAENKREANLKEKGFLTLRDELTMISQQLKDITRQVGALQERVGHVDLDQLTDQSKDAL